MEPFKEDLAKFKTGKDTIQFPYNKPLPKTLIRKIAAVRAKQGLDHTLLVEQWAIEKWRSK